MFITALGHYLIVLGIPWLHQQDVGICFALDLITFGSQYFLAHCTELPTTIKAMQQDPTKIYYAPPLHKQHYAAPKETLEEAFSRPIKINLIGGVPSIFQIRNDKGQVHPSPSTKSTWP